MPNTPGIAVVPSENGQDDKKSDLRLSYDLVQPTAEDWKNQEPEILAQYYAQTEADFFGIVDDYLDQANEEAYRHKRCLQSYQHWSVILIVAGGVLTVINVLAAFNLSKKEIDLLAFLDPVLLNVVAAVFAAALTVARNLESFFNRGEQANGIQERRDLLLSRYREYLTNWVNYVEAYGKKTPMACMNAGRLYRQLVDSDQELRRKLKELTQVEGRDHPSGAKSQADSNVRQHIDYSTPERRGR